MVTRKVRHKNADGTIIEADIGALAENVTEDATHRFITDEERESWNNKPNAEDIDLSVKVDKQGGDISNTVVSTFSASSEEFPVPVAGEAPKTFMGKVKKFFEDFNNMKAGLLTLGQIVNNCTSDRSDLPLAAAQGKALMDQVTQLNNNLTWKQLGVNISPQSSLSAVAYQNDLLKNAYEFCFFINGFGTVYLKQFKNNRFFLYHSVCTSDGYRMAYLATNDNGELFYKVSTKPEGEEVDLFKIIQIWYR